MTMVQFRDMPYVRPDMEALKARYRETIRKLNSAADFAAAKDAFFALQDAEEEVAPSATCATPSTPPTPSTPRR